MASLIASTTHWRPMCFMPSELPLARLYLRAFLGQNQRFLTQGQSLEQAGARWNSSKFMTHS